MAPAPSPLVIDLPSCPSTNTYLATLPTLAELPSGTVVTTPCQTAGRGQRGNTWEAAPGLNITMSMLLRPRRLEARRQFAISEAVSIAIVEVLRRHIPQELGHVSIKWPNDIYVGDRKICGILIEHSLRGMRIGHTIAGIGLNVNQPEFLSDAPNPVSLTQITGRQYSVTALLDELSKELIELFSRVDSEDSEAHQTQLHERYLSMLWRRNHPARYHDVASGSDFTGIITDVDAAGMLSIYDADADSTRLYAFKEVAFIL